MKQQVLIRDPKTGALTTAYEDRGPWPHVRLALRAQYAASRGRGRRAERPVGVKIA